MIITGHAPASIKLTESKKRQASNYGKTAGKVSGKVDGGAVEGYDSEYGENCRVKRGIGHRSL